MKKAVVLLAVLSLLLMGGCAGGEEEKIPFQKNQQYAVAWLGYQKIEFLDRYEDILDGKTLPIHYISKGDYYLVIPRYEETKVMLYFNDVNTSEGYLCFEDPDSGPFILQCNESDIFSDATIRFIHDDMTVEFSPFLSLENGKLQAGEYGLDLTRYQEVQEGAR